MIYNIKVKIINYFFWLLLVIFSYIQTLLGADDAPNSIPPPVYTSQATLFANSNQAIITNSANFLTTENSQTNANNSFNNQSDTDHSVININENSYIYGIPNGPTEQPPPYEDVILQHNAAAPNDIIQINQAAYVSQRNILNLSIIKIMMVIIFIGITIFIIIIIYSLVSLDRTNYSENPTVDFLEND